MIILIDYRVMSESPLSLSFLGRLLLILFFLSMRIINWQGSLLLFPYFSNSLKSLGSIFYQYESFLAMLYHCLFIVIHFGVLHVVFYIYIHIYINCLSHFCVGYAYCSRGGLINCADSLWLRIYE